MKRILILLAAIQLASSLFAADAVPLSQLLDRTGAGLAWDAYRDHGTLSRGTTIVSFAPGRRSAVLNGTENLFIGEVSMEDGGLYFSEEAAARLEAVLSPPERAEDGRHVTAIFIDPGHGGKDPGTIGRHTVDGRTIEVYEKDIVLDVSIRLREMLSQRYPEKEIMLSRDEDVYLTLEERTELANQVNVSRNEAIVYLSIHANASLNNKATGFEVWYLPPEYRRRNLIEARTAGVDDPDVLNILNTIREEEFTIESVLLARNIVDSLDRQVGAVSANRGIKEESWYVVRNAKMPSVLVELGFVTNRDEIVRLQDSDYLNKLALGIYNGISTFISNFEE
ncbi:MAG: N-acetylmuramoyl-L-alanine amidase [Spirochaetaceae bacterium]